MRFCYLDVFFFAISATFIRLPNASGFLSNSGSNVFINAASADSCGFAALFRLVCIMAWMVAVSFLLISFLNSTMES